MNAVKTRTDICEQCGDIPGRGWISSENGVRRCPLCLEEERASAWRERAYKSRRGHPLTPDVMAAMVRAKIIKPKFAEASKKLESKILKGGSFEGKTTCLKTLYNEALKLEGGSIARLLWTTEDELKSIFQDEEAGPDWLRLNLTMRKPRYLFLDELFVEANHLDGRSDRDRASRWHSLFRRFWDMLYSRTWEWKAVIITTNNDYRNIFREYHPKNQNTEGLINRIKNITEGKTIE